jgi:hypothetical protein
LTFDPDLFGCAKFRQNKAIVEFLIFEIPDVGEGRGSGSCSLCLLCRSVIKVAFFQIVCEWRL